MFRCKEVFKIKTLKLLIVIVFLLGFIRTVNATCVDGTPTNSCSSYKPLYCNSNNILVDNCQQCGCAGTQQYCNSRGDCTLYSHIRIGCGFYGFEAMGISSSEVINAANQCDLIDVLPNQNLPQFRSLSNAEIMVYDNYASTTYNHFNVWGNPGQRLNKMKLWADVRSLNAEDFLLHYKFDTVVDPARCGRLIKGWNPADDTNNDGVRDINPPSDPSRTALNRYEARVIYYCDLDRILTNIANINYRQFLREDVNNTLEVSYSGAKYNGVMVDNSGPISYNGWWQDVLEYPNDPNGNGDFARDYAATLGYVYKDVMNPYGRVQVPNQATDWNDGYLVNSSGVEREKGLRMGFWAGYYETMFFLSKYMASLGKIHFETTTDWNNDQGRSFTLSTYYVMKTDYLYYCNFCFNNGWFPAIAYDVGQNISNEYLFAQGGTYKIYARNFTKSIILSKMMIVGGSPTDDSTLTTHSLTSLGSSFNRLNIDGTLGLSISSISLRNGEGAILIRPSAVQCNDVNNDNIINVKDLALEAFWQGYTNTYAQWNNIDHLDLNADNRIDTQDLNSIISSFGNSC